nr:fatty acid cis/trans isomerase [Hoeflea prorocentri]
MASAPQWSTVQPTIEKRCIVCHGCYDAPCQLKLSSPDGLLRGGSKDRVYDSSRLKDAPLSRLGIDARTVEEWRKLGFFSVTQDAGTPAHSSTLMRLLELAHTNPLPQNAPLPDDIGLDVHRKLSCPAPDEIDAYVADHPHGGMPYGTAALSDEEFHLLSSWARAGAPLSGHVDPIPPEITANTDAIETFLNGPDLRDRLVARYLYEHLFLAHLHIEGDSPHRFFRLVRSKSPPGTPVNEIATRRPFDDPGSAPFYYRVTPVDGTILHKEHMVYEIGPERLDRYRALFFSDEWPLDTLPDYSAAAGGNPFTTFAAIPARSRYTFLLDDALYFVRSFIRGPVCYGQVAVDVIEDRFWVSFLEPEADISVTDPTYLSAAAPLLELPVASEGGNLRARASSFLSEGAIKYQRFRDQRYQAKWSSDGGPSYDDVWDGDGSNPDAALTVFRNFDNASVITGFAGDVPETAWVIDFPLFERIYYDLVAGFDVYGNVEHQLTTRLYMDSLRREGETIFLSFLPADMRRQLHKQWYRGPLARIVDWLKEQPVDNRAATGITYRTDSPKSEFLLTLLERGGGLWPVSDPINRCDRARCSDQGSSAAQLEAIASRNGAWVKFLPDIAILAVEGDTGPPELFTLAHDKAHSNVAFLFREENRREPEEDRLTIVPGQFASYPNLFFRVSRQSLSDFVNELTSVRSQEDFMSVVASYGVRRSSELFWQTYDAVQASNDTQDPLQSGLLDLNRYQDPKSDDTPQ